MPFLGNIIYLLSTLLTSTTDVSISTVVIKVILKSEYGILFYSLLAMNSEVLPNNWKAKIIPVKISNFITEHKMLTGPEEVYSQLLKKLGKIHIMGTSNYSEGLLKVVWISQCIT